MSSFISCLIDDGGGGDGDDCGDGGDVCGNSREAC